jgi:hypothetical protein
LRGAAAPPAFVDNAERRKSAGSDWNACSATNYCNYDNGRCHDDDDKQKAGVHGNNATHLHGRGLVDNDGAPEKGGGGGGNASSSSAAKEGRRRRRMRRRGALERCKLMSLDQD